MSMFMRHRTIGFRLGLTVLVVLSLVLAGCGRSKPTPTPTPEVMAGAAPPAVTILKNPNISEVPVGGQVALAVEATGVNLKIAWRPKRGKVSNTEGPSTIYTAPATPGIDTVDVTVSSDGGSTNKTVTFEVFVAVTEESAPTDTPTGTPALTKTPISGPATPTVMARVTATSTPPRGVLTPSPTPAPVIAVVTTKTGLEVKLYEFNWLPQQDRGNRFGDRLIEGIPTQGGVEVSLDYVERVEIGDYIDSAGWPLTITLLDGTVLEDRLKKGQSVSVGGLTDRGPFEKVLTEVRSIHLQRQAPAVQIPERPPNSEEGPSAIVTTGDGTLTDVTGLHFHYCCWSNLVGDKFYGEEKAVPLSSGLHVDLDKVQEISFGGSMDPELVSVSVITLDGSVIADTIDPGPWRLVGSAALGAFDLRVEDAKEVELHHTSPTQIPERPARSDKGPSAVVITRDGDSFDLTGLGFAKPESLWVPFISTISFVPFIPLSGGLNADLAMVREIKFGEISNGQVSVTVVFADGQTITDAIWIGQLLRGNTVLGKLYLGVSDVATVTLQEQ